MRRSKGKKTAIADPQAASTLRGIEDAGKRLY